MAVGRAAALDGCGHVDDAVDDAGKIGEAHEMVGPPNGIDAPGIVEGVDERREPVIRPEGRQKAPIVAEHARFDPPRRGKAEHMDQSIR